MKDRKFIVGVREVHVAAYLMDARDPGDAKKLVKAGLADGSIEPSQLEYSHTLDESLWTAEEER